jgi:preprotein translocase subunit SecE
LKRAKSGPPSGSSRGAISKWQEFTGFLRDVRAEMRKVVAPTWKEVKSTTAVVIIAVFIFGTFFFVVDGLFRQGVHALLKSLGGVQ